MVNKKSFVLRMDEEMFRALEKWAADEFRSVNGQIEWLINQELQQAGRLKKSKEEKTTRPDKEKK
ncbi:MAG TPA: Arc family DNA-binding protein [Puia sp.]|nr:Arc family DNA-binding protein [Puia sp.]